MNIELLPNDPKPYIALGFYYYSNKNYDEAIIYYEKGIKLNRSYKKYLPAGLTIKL